MQNADPAVPEYDPVEQTEHVDAPAEEMVPIAHVVQADAPTVADAVPTEQLAHEIALAEPEYVPTAQEVHDDA